MKTSSTILGILGAAAAGAFLGVLFAPDKGSETRKKIKDKSKDYGDNLKGSIKDKFDGIVSTLSTNGKDIIDEGKAKFNQVKDDFNSMKDEAKTVKTNY